MPLFHMKGVHVPHRKHTASLAPVRMPAPSVVTLPTVMHIGAPAKPIVKVGDTVLVGQVVAEAGGFVSAPIHASVSGTVRKIEPITVSSGASVPAIVIESDGQMTPYREPAPITVSSREEFLAEVRNSGLVGLGGAGFPTSVKLSLKDPSLLDTVIINGAECEPYITSDTRTMLDRAQDIAEGIRLLHTYIGADKFVIGVEKNKPACIEKMKQIRVEGASVSIKALPSSYPQGGEKVLIHQTTGRIVPEGKLPIDAGCIVINCTTLACLAEYFRTGMPLVEKCVTVDGSAVTCPQNLLVPIGTPVSEVFAFCGGFSAAPGKVLYGGPMMGISLSDLSAPVLKNTNALLAFDQKDSRAPEETPCLRCGKCVRNCPMQLNPPAIAKAYSGKDGAQLQKLKVNLCMECGACAFHCPARRRIVQRNRLAKGVLRSYEQAQKQKEANKS